MSRLRRLLPRTLRARISLLSAVAVLGVLVAAGAYLVTAQRAALTDNLDDTLDAQARAVAEDLRAGREVGPRTLLSEDLVVTVTGPDGADVRTAPAGATPLPAGPPGVRTVQLGGGTRLLTRRVDGATVRIAGSLEDVRASTRVLVSGLALAVPLTGSVLAVVVWWAVGRALRPVEDIRRRVEVISGSRLDRRVPEPPTPTEIARLARTMNAMLARLQVAAERQRTFVADAAHELRSPLARMRAELEVDQAHPGSADPEATAASTLAEAVGLQRLVDDLLLLARGDAGAVTPASTLLDLDEVVAGPVARARAAGADVDSVGVRPVQVRGDRPQLERVVGNLVDNAVRHARRRVTVTLAERSGGRAVLTVADDGPGIPEADRERVFERFTRLDEARSAGGGAGLGLAIARDIVERHQGSLTVDPTATTGALFVVVLPVDGGGLPGGGPG